MTDKGPIQSFVHLTAWQEAHSFGLGVYRATKQFPSEEQFGLTSQVRRAVVSVTSNIAEGFTRQTPKDKAHFYATAMGSLTEAQSQLLFARDLGFLSEEQFSPLAERSATVGKLINGLIRSTRARRNP